MSWFFDYSDGNFAMPMSNNMAMDSSGNLMMRMGDHMAMDMTSGEMHMVSGWSSNKNDDDDEDDW